MTDSDLTPLDPRFPIALSEEPAICWQILGTWQDPATIVAETRRAIAQAQRREERYVAAPTEPIPLVLAHGDRFARDDGTDAAVDAIWAQWTDTRSLAREIRAAERHPGRRAWQAIGRVFGRT